MTDEEFFIANPERQTHVRLPTRHLAKTRQRKMVYIPEQELAFHSLGRHDPKLRRIVVYRVPPDNPLFDPEKQQLLNIPFLALEGEVIPDTDEVLLPLIDSIMKAQQQ